MKIENSDLSSRLTELEKEVVDKNDRITLLQVQLESTTSAFQSKDAFNSQGYFCAILYNKKPKLLPSCVCSKFKKFN